MDTVNSLSVTLHYEKDDDAPASTLSAVSFQEEMTLYAREEVVTRFWKECGGRRVLRHVESESSCLPLFLANM